MFCGLIEPAKALMIVLFEKKDKKGPHILFHSMLSYVLIDAHLYTFSTAVFMHPGTWLCF